VIVVTVDMLVVLVIVVTVDVFTDGRGGSGVVVGHGHLVVCVGPSVVPSVAPSVVYSGSPVEQRGSVVV
jgi:hypothetical protein